MIKVSQTSRIFSRDCLSEFDAWLSTLDNHRQILYVKGARQVGKTTEILRFCSQNFKHVVYLNILEDASFVKFLSGTSESTFLKQFEHFCKLRKIRFENTLDSVLILDEIQANIPEVYNKLRYLRRLLNCAIIATGSYLGVLATNAQNVYVPVGDTWDVTMTPLTFDEVCRELPTSTREEAYNLYRKIGGYPAVLKQYILSKDINSCYALLERLWSGFCTESYKYMTQPVMNVFDSVLNFLLEQLLQEKAGAKPAMPIRDMLNYLTNRCASVGLDKKDIVAVLNWLTLSGILGVCQMHRDGDITKATSAIRYYLKDVGLLSCKLRFVPIRDESNKAGLITECFVYNELTSYALDPHCLTCNDCELDFAFYKTGCITGLEVKTTNGNAKSLRYFKEHKLIDVGYKVCSVAGVDNILLWELYKLK